MSTRTYILNAHAGKYDGVKQFKLPPRVTCYFYADWTGYIKDSVSVAVYKKIFSGEPTATRTVTSGSMIDNYGLWSLDRPDFPSGVIRRKTKKRRIAIDGMSEHNPTSFREVVNILASRSGNSEIHLHCLICTYHAGLVIGRDTNFQPARELSKTEA